MPPLLSIILFLVVTLQACAQQSAPAPATVVEKKTAPEQVYTFVEQMPELLSGGGERAVASLLLRTLQVPKLPVQLPWPPTKVSFIVGADGKIYDEQVFLLEPIPAYRQAMLRAIQILPRFKPGSHAGKPVAVKLTFPFSCILIQ